jgi:hypothetical protein
LSSSGNNLIAGWSINPTTLEKVDTNGGVRIDSTNKRMDFLSNATAIRLRVGQVDSNQFGMRGFDGSGNRVFEISEVRNELSGWTIGTSTIAKGTDVILDATNKKITLGNGSIAMEHNSGTPQIRSATNFTTGNGFFLSSAGTNNFRVGNASAARLQFTGTNLEIYNSSNTKLVSMGASNTIAGWDITSTTITKNNATINSNGTIFLGAGSSYQADDTIFLDGANERMSIGSGFSYSSDQLTIDGNALIAGWAITSGAITKGDVSLQANTTKPGLHITDGTDTILNVVSSSTGLTNVNDLTGSLGSGAAVQFTNNDFSVGASGSLLDTVSNTWVIDGTSWDSWEYDPAGEINSERAGLLGKTIAVADYGTAYNAGFRRDYPVEKGAKATVLVSAYVRGNGWKFYGDAAKVVSYIDMELSGSTQTSNPNSFTAIGSKRVQFTATKLQNVQIKLRNPSYNFVRLKFNAYVQASATGKAPSITTGGYGS